jgi:hypothetical protein
MIEAWDIFNILMKRDQDIHVKIDDDFKYIVKGEGTITFHIDLGGSLDGQDVLYVPRLKNKFLLVSDMGDSGFSITFQRGQVLIHPEKAS